MTGNSRTNDSVGMRFSNFAYLDPSSNSGFANGYKKCVPIWNECINKYRTPKDSFINLFMTFIKKYGNNKSIYNPFLKEYSIYKFKNSIDIDDEDGLITTCDINDYDIGIFSYYPEEKPEIIEGNNKKI